MLDYLKTWLELKTDERAVTMLEYGLLAALIAVVVIGAVSTLGTNLSSVFGYVAGKVTTSGT